MTRIEPTNYTPLSGEQAVFCFTHWEIRTGDDIEPEPVPTVPESAERWQVHKMLLFAGLLDQVLEWCEEDPQLRIDFKERATIRRRAAKTIEVAYRLGLTDEEIDELFTGASKLT